MQAFDTVIAINKVDFSLGVWDIHSAECVFVPFSKDQCVVLETHVLRIYRDASLCRFSTVSVGVALVVSNVISSVTFYKNLNCLAIVQFI